MSQCADFHIDDSISAILLQDRRSIGQRVLIAYISGNSSADGCDLIRRFRKECFAAGFFRKSLEHAWVLIAVPLIEDADRIDDCIGRFSHFNKPGKTELAGIVAAIADHDKNLLVASAFLEVIEGCGNRIVERGFANRMDCSKGALQLILPIRERNIRWQTK